MRRIGVDGVDRPAQLLVGQREKPLDALFRRVGQMQPQRLDQHCCRADDTYSVCVRREDSNLCISESNSLVLHPFEIAY